MKWFSFVPLGVHSQWQIQTHSYSAFSTYGPRYLSNTIIIVCIIVSAILELVLLPVVIMLMEGIGTWLLSVKMGYHRWWFHNFKFCAHYLIIYLRKILLIYWSIFTLESIKKINRNSKFLFNLIPL